METKKLNKKKICLNTIVICILAMIIIIMICEINGMLGSMNSNFSITSDSNTTEITTDHLRYITEDTVDDIKDNSIWNTDEEKKKLLDETFDKNIETIDSIEIEGSEQ